MDPLALGQALHKSEEGAPQPKEFGGIMQALRELLVVTEQMHRCHATFGAACYGSVCLPHGLLRKMNELSGNGLHQE